MYKKIFFSLLCIFLVANILAQSTIEIKVWKNIEALNKAIFIQKDSIVLNLLLNNDVSYGHSGGNVEDKKTMITKALANVSTYSNVETQKLSIKIIGNTAVARHILSATETKDGKQSLLKLNVLQVWQKIVGKWKLVARQSAKLVTN